MKKMGEEKKYSKLAITSFVLAVISLIWWVSGYLIPSQTLKDIFYSLGNFPTLLPFFAFVLSAISLYRFWGGKEIKGKVLTWIALIISFLICFFLVGFMFAMSSF